MQNKRWQSDMLKVVDDTMTAYRKIQAIAESDDESDAKSLIELRRTISIHLGDLSRLINQAPIPAEQIELRHSFSRVRAALADHQARWPAVSIRNQRKEYRASMLKLDADIGSFVDMCRIAARRN